MRLAILGFFFFVLSTLWGYWVGTVRRLQKFTTKSPAQAKSAKPAAPARTAPVLSPPPDVDLPSDERARVESLPPPSPR